MKMASWKRATIPTLASDGQGGGVDVYAVADHWESQESGKQMDKSL